MLTKFDKIKYAVLAMIMPIIFLSPIIIVQPGLAESEDGYEDEEININRIISNDDQADDAGEQLADDSRSTQTPAQIEKEADLKPPVQTAVPATTIQKIKKTETLTDDALVNPDKVTEKTSIAPIKDSDQDGIAEQSDKHPGEDDFAYFIKDDNRDGIADDLETIADNLLKNR